MKNIIYCLFNRLSCRFSDVMAFPTDGFAVKRLVEQFSKRGETLDEITLYKIGEIDISTGINTSCPPVPIPWNMTLPTESKATPSHHTEDTGN